MPISYVKAYKIQFKYFHSNHFYKWLTDMSTTNLGIYKRSHDVIFWKWSHIVIVTSNRLNISTVMVRFIQATSIDHFQIEDCEFITNLRFSHFIQW